ncbi:hypothetical protein [Roseateles puraquae]|uniref:Uncharacterized protein n=1 Tax=Roseateles puraquae TaxID=431059 RepID=A0A254NF26_9BURK|nr:hypothetical protein [Roseateles puraquae]MDG0857345.1 hypothetical protein [Roseateles puraquae]OWR03988.1 hypothetical protein CDO81_12405 [Roseateles puraquae]
MDKFARWSGVVYTALPKVHRVKLGQVHQLLAACFGHASYASFRDSDLQVLNQGARYVCFDEAAGLRRARCLGILITEAQWREAWMSLKPSGVSGGTWIIEAQAMELAARVTFEDASHPEIQTIKQSIGMGDGHWANSARCLDDIDAMPELLRFEVLGDVQAYGNDVSLSVPVAAELAFKRIGRRMYAAGELLDVVRRGAPREYEPDFEAEIYGMSED